MRLTLDLPPDAEFTGLNNHLVRLASEPWLRIQIGPLFPAPSNRAEWLKQVLLAGDVTDSSSARVLGSTRLQTRSGWPCEMVDVVVGESSGTEHRLVGLYEMLGHVASVV